MQIITFAHSPNICSSNCDMKEAEMCQTIKLQSKSPLQLDISLFIKDGVLCFFFEALTAHFVALHDFQLNLVL